MAALPISHSVLKTESELRAHMPEPKARVAGKKIHQFEKASRFFIAHTACVGITTARPGGGAQVSARVGEPGFLHVASDETLWIPDRDEGRVGPSAEAIGEAGFAGLIFLVRGVRDTLRANGRATLAEGDELPEPVRRIADRAIRIDIDEAFLHCPKAFLRSKFWESVQSVDSPPAADAGMLGPAESAFLSESPFVLLGTHGPEGAADLSPRGDPGGFVRQLASGALLLPDRPGNHIADSMRNVLATEAVGLLALVPGRAEALAISGRAELVAGEEVWSESAVKGRTPDLGFRIEVLEASLHSAPALEAFWAKDDRVDPKKFPTLAELLLTQLDPNGRGKRLKAWALDTSLRRDEKVNLY